MRLFIPISFLLLMCISTMFAHGDLDLRIKAITSEIESFPDSAALYFHRGKLRFQHEEYQASIDDIDMSITKGFQDELQNIYLAKSFFKLDELEDASTCLSSFLENDSGNVVGLNLKGRILFAQKDYEASALCFEQVIKLSVRSLPENYLEAANSWIESSNPDRYQKAVGILEIGIQNLGSIVTLQNQLIKIHLNANNSQKAINLQLSIIEKLRRKESAYFKLAEIYLQLGELEEAKNAALDAKHHLEKLPSRIRKNSAMKSLEDKIQKLINKVQ